MPESWTSWISQFSSLAFSMICGKKIKISMSHITWFWRICIYIISDNTYSPDENKAESHSRGSGMLFFNWSCSHLRHSLLINGYQCWHVCSIDWLCGLRLILNQLTLASSLIYFKTRSEDIGWQRLHYQGLAWHEAPILFLFFTIPYFLSGRKLSERE